MNENNKLDEILNDAKENVITEPLQRDEKQRVLDMTLCKIATEKKRPYFSRYAKATIIVLSACIVGATAVVANSSFGWTAPFKNFFYSYNNETQLNDNTTIVEKSCTQNGITVSVPEVIGDKYGLYILIEIKGVSDSENYYYPGFKKAEVIIDGKDEKYICDRPTDEGLHNGTQDLIYHVNTQESLVGKNIILNLSDYGSYESDIGDKFSKKLSGNWNIKWVLDYKDQSVTIPVNKTLAAFGGQVTIQELIVSPISATFVLKDTKNLSKAYDREAENNRIKVKFMDGSIVDSAFVDSGTINSDQKLVSINYNKAMNTSQIESVTFAGLTIPVNNNKNPIIRQNLNVAELGFSINMTKKLYDAISSTEITINKDDYFKCKKINYAFVGKVDNTEMKMFSIIVYDKIINKSEFEDAPMNYIGTKNGCTYLLYAAEDGTDEQVKLFGDLINDDVAKLVPWISLDKTKS